MVRIVVVHNRYASQAPSGENVVVAQEIELLREAGHEVHTYLRDSDEIAAFGPLERAGLAIRPIRSRADVHAFATLLTDVRPDVVHLHNPYPLISPWVVRVAAELDVPVVQTVHNYRMSCVAGSFYRDGHACEDCLGRALPWPAVAHGCYRGSRVQSVPMRTTLIRGQAAGARHYFYGATEDVLQALSKRVAEFAPQAAIVGMHSPPFIALTSEQVSEDAEAMRAAQPDIVWIGLGTPKQDRAVAAFASELDATLVPVGAAFDFLAGTKREAPRLLRNSGLEWVFRLLTEPRRLWRRYVFGNVGFLWGVLRGGVHRLAPGATTTNG